MTPPTAVRASAVLALILGSVPTFASVFAPGDLFVGRSSFIDWRDSSGVPASTISTGFRPTGMRNHPITGQLWATTFASNVRVYDTMGALAATYSTPGLQNPESVVFDTAGNAFIGGPDVSSSAMGTVIKLSPTGQLLQSYSVPREDRGSDWIDLCSDDATLYYTSEGSKVKRYDLTGAGATLPDFADLAGYVNPSGQPTKLFAVRVMPNGDVLAAGSNDLYLLDSSGQVIRNYLTPSLDAFFSLAITPSGTEFWAAGSGPGGKVYKFNIGTGALVTSFSVGAFGETAGIAIFRDDTRGSCVPAPGAAVMAPLAAALLMPRRRR